MILQKLVIAASIAAVVASTLPASAAQQDPDGQVRPGVSTSGGRYQLFQGLHSINNQGTVFNNAGVFKIDSVSGRVWKYEEGRTKDGTFFKHWAPIEDVR